MKSIPQVSFAAFYVNSEEVTVEEIQQPDDNYKLVVKMTGAMSTGVANGWSKTVVISSAEDADWGDLDLTDAFAEVKGTSPEDGMKYFVEMYWLNGERAQQMSMAERYVLSFETHYRLVTIHPWADGNGRMARLMMNHLQFEFGLIPAKVLKEDKAEYINALIATRENEDIHYFVDFMTGEMVKTIASDIDAFLKSAEESGEKKPENGEKKQKSREKILALLRQDPHFTIRKLADAIGITPKAIEKHVAKLKAEGLIERDGPDKGGKWKVP